MIDILWSCTILTAPPSMKNSRRLVRGKNKQGAPIPRIIKSGGALAWSNIAMIALAKTRPKQPFADDLTLYAEIHYPSRRSDLSVELLMDLLQKGGVIANDRQIRRVIAEAFIDKDNPRVVVALSSMNEARDQAVRRAAAG